LPIVELTFEHVGWKSVFAVGQNTSHINDVSEYESKHLLKWFVKLVSENHDLQVRFRWRDANDVGKYLLRRSNASVPKVGNLLMDGIDTAIWDNRSVLHTPTYDFEGTRTGQRAVSLGERPYLDPTSTGRREALSLATLRQNLEYAEQCLHVQPSST
jgi:hypothetical protein